MGTKSNVEQLNSFLRGELAAVETYRMALDKVEGGRARDEVLACMKSHQDRVQLLTDAVIACGGEPATSSGPWGVFAKAVEGGAKVFGEKAAISALEEGEDHGMKDYQADIDKLDPSSRRLVSDRLLPLQQQTHSRLSRLKHQM